MRTLLGTILFAAAMHGYPQSLEADLDGNASALQASEMPSASKRAAKPDSKKVAKPSSRSRRA